MTTPAERAAGRARVLLERDATGYQTPKRVPKLAHDVPAPAGFRFAKAKGGSYWHVLPAGSDKALCGHEPRSRYSRYMSGRAGWWGLKDPLKGVPSYNRPQHVLDVTFCRKCEAAL